MYGRSTALLEWRLLLRRSKLPAAEAIELPGAIQAQSTLAPYVGLWARLDGSRPDELVRLMNDPRRRASLSCATRSTRHPGTARDCLILRSLTQVIADRNLRVNPTFAPSLRSTDVDALAARACRVKISLTR